MFRVKNQLTNPGIPNSFILSRTRTCIWSTVRSGSVKRPCAQQWLQYVVLFDLDRKSVV